MAATAEAPAAPPAEAPAAQVAPTPAEIHVTPATVIDRGPQAPPPKPGSAKDRMFKALRTKAGVVDEPETKPAVTPVTPATPEAKPETTEKPVEGEPTVPATEVQPAVAPQGKGKVSPWKLVDEHKAARLKAETELAELRKKSADPAKLTEIEERAAKAEARAKELEDHIRFVDYSKSQEFADKYQKPYTDAWTRWMNDLGELTVQDAATGNERPISSQDLVELINLPLQRAREQAESTFGTFADDVMSARKEIKALFDAQHRALEEAKKGGAERIEREQKEIKERQSNLRKEMNQIWTQANQEAQTDERISKFFKPVEGDEEGNKRLAKGFELADQAFALDPFNPNITSEERAKIVRLHAAVRNRAAAFGRLTFENRKLQSQIETLIKELDSYKEATPGTTNERPPEQRAPGRSAREEIMAELRKRAH